MRRLTEFSLHWYAFPVATLLAIAALVYGSRTRAHDEWLPFARSGALASRLMNPDSCIARGKDLVASDLSLSAAGTGGDSSLNLLAAARGRYFGTATTSYYLRGNPDYAALVAREAGVITSEGELKWKALQPTPDRYVFTGADSLLAFANAHGMRLRGHVLVWHGSVPSWFSSFVTPENADSVLKGHITSVVRRYAGRIRSWDVVNEAIQVEDGRPDGLRRTPLLEAFGTSYIATAFRAARAADPAAELVYNENRLEYAGLRFSRHRHATLELLRSLKRDGVPVDALGIQAHLWTAANFDPRAFTAFLDSVQALGLNVIITELDVREDGLLANDAGRDQQIACFYGEFLSTALKHPSVTGVITWGLSDRFSWLSTYGSRRDGLPVRPLPYDRDMRAKPARDALAQALRITPTSPQRRLVRKSDVP